MSTDRELLELAAKAAGYRLKNEMHNASDELIGFRTNDRPMSGAWNPLTDDGDALRLAVKLGMFMEPIVREISRAEYEADPYASTRRAIVRAAAAIGKDMP